MYCTNHILALYLKIFNCTATCSNPSLATVPLIPPPPVVPVPPPTCTVSSPASQSGTAALHVLHSLIYIKSIRGHGKPPYPTPAYPEPTLVYPSLPRNLPCLTPAHPSLPSLPEVSGGRLGLAWVLWARAWQGRSAQVTGSE
ncbi:hypothetical protein E2C01_068054 [Portunus trituberculatus]|uniref:Uncharacterized protein n=1 Tax=Portunus trituberculatus TaxID=210409 RepID=A0A5B7HWV7_PORTR|nr:hypothetical protein [Portunus trituberculatus]